MTRKVVRVADLQPPRPISDEDFTAICCACSIPTKQQAEVRDFLAQAVTAFGEALTCERTLPTREADRLAITQAIDAVRRAQQCLKRNAGRAGRRGLREAGRHVAPALSVSWMRRHFPADGLVPNAIYWPSDDRSLRSPERVPTRPMDTDDLTLDQRIRFMEQRGGAAIAMLLGDLIAALESGRREIVQLPDGRKPLAHRAYLLAALAELWDRLGRKPTSGLNSKFGSFCEAVFEPIGWPTEGVKSALPDAIKLWRHLYR